MISRAAAGVVDGVIFDGALDQVSRCAACKQAVHTVAQF
mgnify:CR=1 FL=1